jgi:uncharacterized membrane protein YiaA
MSVKTLSSLQVSNAYSVATVAALAVGAIGFLLGLWNAEMPLNEKGLYMTNLAFGLFAAVSLQKCVRDAQEGMPVSAAYHSLCFVAVALSLGMLTVSLWNATLLLSEKGYYGVSFILALYAAVSVQKNLRDRSTIEELISRAESQRNRNVTNAS